MRADLADRLRESIERHCLAAGNKTALAMEAEAIKAAPKSLGDMARAIHSGATLDGSILRVRLVCNSPYAKFIEEGTGPAVGHQKYMPPPGALALWVKRTLSPPAPKGDQEAALKAVENAVRWKIYMKGTKPHPFIRPAAVVGRKVLRRELIAGVRAAVREVAHG